MTLGRLVTRVALGAGVGTVLSLAPASVLAQTAASVAARCVVAGGDVDLCRTGATAAHSLLGHSALQAGMGSPIPGTASNLGTRVGGDPRLSFYVQSTASSWGLPGRANFAEETSPLVTGIRLGAAAGLFDGFRLMPTVGGFLATDVFVDASTVFTGGGDGFSGRHSAFALGARIGLVREGFTLPGASVSLARRFSGSLGYGDAPAGDVVDVVVDPSTTSLRFAVSKDLFAVEVLGGFGWDRFFSDVTLQMSDGGGGTLVVDDAMEGSRRLYFASAAMTFSLVLTLSVEGGWAEGSSVIPGYAGAFDPSAGGAFGSFSARLVF
ncbi:MAG: hypothetical protein KJO65_02060 [Gemmatimonadetes bacterium]|nr:hypothetical protein [Gemmatimonadota bacterium]